MKQSPQKRSRPGTIAPLTALLLIPLLAMAAFAVKQELICHPVPHDAADARWAMGAPFEEIEFDLHMVPANWPENPQ